MTNKGESSHWCKIHKNPVLSWGMSCSLICNIALNVPPERGKYQLPQCECSIAPLCFSCSRLVTVCLCENMSCCFHWLLLVWSSCDCIWLNSGLTLYVNDLYILNRHNSHYNTVCGHKTLQYNISSSEHTECLIYYPMTGSRISILTSLLRIRKLWLNWSFTLSHLHTCLRQDAFSNH